MNLSNCQHETIGEIYLNYRDIPNEGYADRPFQIYMKDAHCAETNEKSNFQFSFFELWLINLQVTHLN